MNYFVNIHKHGHICLEDMLGSELSIVNNARVSFDQHSDELGESELGLLNFLMKNRHGSPWEAVVFRFDIKAPLFVIREWQRHRIGSFNEQSARYSQISEEFYVPVGDYLRRQVGKPGNYSYEPLEGSEATQTESAIYVSQYNAFLTYRKLLSDGVAKEIARLVLPVGMYSRMKWTVNLRSLFNFLSLRNHEHAQREIRDYAIAVEDMVTERMPAVMQMFNEHGRVSP